MPRRAGPGVTGVRARPCSAKVRTDGVRSTGGMPIGPKTERRLVAVSPERTDAAAGFPGRLSGVRGHHGGQPDAEGRPLVDHGLNLDLAAGILEGTLCDRESEAHAGAFVLGGVEGGEDSSELLGRDSVTVVDDAERHVPVFGPGRDLDLTLFADRVVGVLDQIPDRLSDLLWNASNHAAGSVEPGRDLHLSVGAGFDQGQHIADRLVDLEVDRLLGVALTCIAAHELDDLLDATDTGRQNRLHALETSLRVGES